MNVNEWRHTFNGMFIFPLKSIKDLADKLSLKIVYTLIICAAQSY